MKGTNKTATMTAVTLTPVAVKTYGPGVGRCAVGSPISPHFRSKGLEARRDKTGGEHKALSFCSAVISHYGCPCKAYYYLSC